MVAAGSLVEKHHLLHAERRPFLDGLRAVAVYLVVLFHAGVDRAAGGFIGVDVFFVLSGYLVTQVLVRDVTSVGSIRLARFYARRFRRLLPAAVVALLVTGAAYSMLASPREVLAAIPGFRAAFLYSTNWYLIRQSTNYFAADIQSNPVLHFWSLAVEEQFYLVWPLLLGGLFVFTRRWSRQIAIIRAIVLAGALASLTWALLLRVSNPTRAYYGTDARAYQLLAGALLALAPGLVTAFSRHVRKANLLAFVSLGALAFVASLAVHLDVVQRGIAATVITVLLILSLEASPTRPLAKLLSLGPVVYLGAVSYGTYLWHWPVILIATRVADPNPLQLTIITVLVATGLASLSYQILERPIREHGRLNRIPRVTIAVGLAMSVVCAAVLVPIDLRARERHTAVAALAQGSGRLPTASEIARVRQWGIGRAVSCLGEDPSRCTVVQGTGEHWLLIGDSNAEMMIPAFESLAHKHNLTLSLSVTAGCPWQQNLVSTLNVGPCRANKSDAYARVIPVLHPDVIVVMNSARELEAAPSDVADMLLMTPKTIATLRGFGARVIIVEPLPLKPGLKNPLDCLAQARAVDDCRFVVSEHASPLERLYRQIDAQYSDVTAVNLDRLACPYLPICDPVINRTIVRWDQRHLSRPYVDLITPEIDKYFTDNALVR